MPAPLPAAGAAGVRCCGRTGVGHPWPATPPRSRWGARPAEALAYTRVHPEVMVDPSSTPPPPTDTAPHLHPSPSARCTPTTQPIVQVVVRNCGYQSHRLGGHLSRVELFPARTTATPAPYRRPGPSAWQPGPPHGSVSVLKGPAGSGIRTCRVQNQKPSDASESDPMTSPDPGCT
jgi:hypothetical protein